MKMKKGGKEKRGIKGVGFATNVPWEEVLWVATWEGGKRGAKKERELESTEGVGTESRGDNVVGPVNACVSVVGVTVKRVGIDGEDVMG